MDKPRRDRAIAELQRVAMDDVAVVPTHFQENVWATRRGLVLSPRMDEATLAEAVRRE
jgi:peptide/nickel transport system substrate-binding protein